MREIRIYQPGDYSVGQVLELSPQAAQHVAVVLRMQQGQQLTLFCGDNREFTTTIVQIKKKQVMVSIDALTEQNRESSLAIHLAQALSKGDKMEWVMQKSVELGVASITPLITAHCVVKLDPERMAKKLQQWQGIVIAACEQSGRNTVPLVHPPLSIQEYFTKVETPLKFILHPKENKTWRDYQFSSKSLALIIGPEGGLSNEEVEEALKHDFLPLTLGPRILRTETAAITALSVLQAIGGDL